MANVFFKKGLLANLPASYAAGTFYVTTDERAMYLDIDDSTRIRLGDFIQVDAVANLPIEGASTTALYYCVAENILAKWNGTTWTQINKQPTAEEMKTLLGLGSLAYLSEVAESNLNTELAKKINDASAANHGHENKDVIDGITAEKVAAWDAAEGNAKGYADGLNTAMNTRVEALEAIDHEHANKALLDTYAQTEANLADAVAKKHSHTFNETELNKIVEGDVAKWNAAEKNAKDYADGLDGAMNTRVEALETAIGENGSVATQIKTAIEALDFTDVAVDGEYVSAVNEVDGKISVIRKAFPDYSNTYDAKGAADTAFENAKAYADGLAANYDEKGAAAGVKTELETEIAKKVDKVEGKSLVSDTEITKLAGVSEGANKVEASENNGSIKIDGVETVVYTHPDSHIVSEISDFDEKVKAYDYATKTEAQGYANAKDEAIAAAQKAADDAQDAIDAYIESNNAALSNVKATADAAAVKSDVDAALADRYTKTEADGKFAIKGEDSYDDTVLAGRVTAAEGKITALETASATHALKSEVEAVDAKFANYKTAEAQKAIDDEQDRRLGVIEGDYLKAADIADFETKENVKKVADDFAAYVESNDAAVADRYTKAEADGKFALIADAYDDEEVRGLISDNADAIAAEAERAAGIEAGLRTDVDAIKGDYLKGADKTELEGKITAEETRAKGVEESLQTQINTIMSNPDAEGAINSINEFTQYVKDHGTIAEGFRADIDKNKEDIAANTKAIGDEATRADAAEKALAGRLDILEAIDHEAYVAADTALKTELEGKIADGDAATLEAAKTDASNKDAVVLSEAQAYTDAAKAAAIADAAGKYETIGTAQGIVDGLKLAETYEPIGAEARAIAAAEGKVNKLAGNVYTKAEVEAFLTWGEF